MCLKYVGRSYEEYIAWLTGAVSKFEQTACVELDLSAGEDVVSIQPPTQCECKCRRRAICDFFPPVPSRNLVGTFATDREMYCRRWL